jgi:hypothetical protein
MEGRFSPYPTTFHSGGATAQPGLAGTRLASLGSGTGSSPHTTFTPTQGRQSHAQVASLPQGRGWGPGSPFRAPNAEREKSLPGDELGKERAAAAAAAKAKESKQETKPGGKGSKNQDKMGDFQWPPSSGKKGPSRALKRVNKAYSVGAMKAAKVPLKSKSSCKKRKSDNGQDGDTHDHPSRHLRRSGRKMVNIGSSAE